MLLGRRYLLQLTPEQERYCEQIAGACRAVWNTGLEQRRHYAARRSFIGYASQCLQLTDAKRDPELAWLAEAPIACLQQALKDLDQACRGLSPFKVRWRSRSRTRPSFRFADSRRIQVERVSKRWGIVKLSKIGILRFRWTRSIGGEIRSAAVLQDGGRWYVSFLVEDGFSLAVPNQKPAVGVDRGVSIAVATSENWLRDRTAITPGEAKRLKRLQQQVNRCQRGSNRRNAVKSELRRLHARLRARTADFNAWTANRLTANHGVVVFEALRIKNMTASASGTVDAPGRNVRQKAGLNRAILAKGWGDLVRRCEYKAVVNGSRIVRVPAAYTSQTCNACKHVDPMSRESQARFRCTACGHQDNADVNAAKNILAAGLAVTGRGDLGEAQSAKRQPPRRVRRAPSVVEAPVAGVEVNLDTGRF